MLLGKLQAKVGVDLTVKDLFLYPTVSSMARLIEHRKSKVVELEALPQLDLVKEVERHDQGKVK